MNSDRPALLFPGQGAQDAHMLDAVSQMPTFSRRHASVEKALGHSPLERIASDPTYDVHGNLRGSLLTVLASAVALDQFLETHSHNFSHVAGYSIGQWTSMYAAGMLDFEELVELVCRRAFIMDKCCAQNPGSMIAVIGVSEEIIRGVLNQIQGEVAVISNYNCVGQYSLSGTVSAIRQASDLLLRHQPKKIVHLPMSGAWHSPLMSEAANEFATCLKSVSFAPPSCVVLDNVNGLPLPSDPVELRRQLALHLSSPVRWQDCVTYMLDDGATNFLEIGYGNMLSKFGFFISRKASFTALGDASHANAACRQVSSSGF